LDELRSLPLFQGRLDDGEGGGEARVDRGVVFDGVADVQDDWLLRGFCHRVASFILISNLA